MPLPPRQEFDLEGAADYLGCSTGDVFYYLDEGLLRLAVSTKNSPELTCVAFDRLPTAQQQLLNSLYNPDGIDLNRIKLGQALLDAGKPVASLYLTHHQRNKIKDTVHELGEPIWIFQDLAGEQITIWYEGSLKGSWLYEERGWIVDTYLAREELDRLATKPNSKEKVNAKLKPEESPTKRKTDIASGQELVAYPNLADEIARLMVDQMNQFIAENGRIASEKELRDFLVAGVSYISYDHRDKQLEIGEKEDRPEYLAFRDFKRRYKNYFDPK